jgi:hypothetical protein
MILPFDIVKNINFIGLIKKRLYIDISVFCRNIQNFFHIIIIRSEHMILFSASKLEQALSTDSLDSWEKTKYLMLYLSLGAISQTFPMFIHLVIPTFGQSPPPTNLLRSTLCGIAGIILTYWGVRKCHHINEGADGKDFLGRFLALCFPASFKIFVVTLLLMTVGMIVSSGGPSLLPLKEFVIYLMYVMVIVITYAFYCLMSRTFDRLAILIKQEGINSNVTERGDR